MRIALDNFGTGYASLYHLRNFGIDKIKIDRSFIQARASEKQSPSIVNALVGLGQGFGLTIAADGVDAVEHETSLRNTGCMQGQGLMFSVPVTAEQTRHCFDAVQQIRSSSGDTAASAAMARWHMQAHQYG